MLADRLDRIRAGALEEAPLCQEIGSDIIVRDSSAAPRDGTR